MGKPRKVAQYTLEGEFIRTYKSANYAAICLNKTHGNRGYDILQACKFVQTFAFGYRWLYADDMPRAKELFEQHPLYDAKPHTFEEILEAAADCKTKQEFRDKHSDLYCYAYKKKWMGKLNFERVVNPYKDNCYTVYVIPFYETNTVYVGLTDNLCRRWGQHTDADAEDMSGALKYSIETGIPMPDYPLVLEEKLYAREALYFEDFWKKLYKSIGFNVLNKAKTGVGSGSLGGVIRRLNKEVFEAAEKCKTLKEFQDYFPKEYCLAARRNLVDKLNLERAKEKNGTYSEEYCYNFMAQFKTTKEALEINHNLYDAARDNKWLKQYWWLYDARITPVIKTTGFRIKIYSSPKNCYTENKLKKSTLLRSIKSGKQRNGSYYHYLDINDIEFDIPDFEHRYII